MIIIKVLHVISGNDYGGGARYVMNICMASKGKIDNYLCCIGSGPLHEMAERDCIKVETLSVKGVLKGGLNKLIKENSIDVVNFHGAKSNFLYLFIQRFISVPVVVTIHSDYRYDFLNNKIKYFLYTPLSTLGLKKFKYYICVSKTLKNLLEEKKFEGIKLVIQNGIAVSEYNPIISSQNIRTMYNIKQDDFLFVMVARMHPIKNHRTLIIAFEKLKKDYNNIKLLLVGDGELLPTLQDEVKKYNLDKDILFTGYKVNSTDFINASNISILTSFSEGGAPPIVVLESGLVKKPVICSNVGDMESIISAKQGYLINPNSIEDIYNKMKQAIIDRNKLPSMGEELYNKVYSEYSIESFWNKYHQFYTKIISIK